MGPNGPNPALAATPGKRGEGRQGQKEGRGGQGKEGGVTLSGVCVCVGRRSALLLCVDLGRKHGPTRCPHSMDQNCLAQW